MEPVVAVRELGCSADRARMWSALAETHRFAEAVGGGRLSYQPLLDAGAARYLTTVRIAGLEISYEERPFEWRENEFIAIRRVLHRGPARHYSLASRLEERPGGGCRVELRLEVLPRNALAWPLVRVQVAMMAGRMERLLQQIDANLRAGKPPYSGQAAPRVDAAALARARAVLEKSLAPGERALAGRLADYIAAVPDIDAGRIRPYALAERWQEDRRATLSSCLQAVRAGLLELSWQVVCPSCRVGAREVASLQELEAEVHCPLCDITSAIDFDRSVEATFRPAAAVRPVEAGPYCISGPFLMPHVVEQGILPGGGSLVLRAPRQAGRYRLFVRGGAVASVDVGEGGTTQADLHAGVRLEPGHLRVAPGGDIQLTDGLGAERHVKLEHLEWASQAATAHDVSTLPAFRLLFGSEVLKPGRRLLVTRATFVFTDLSGSTELYAEIGDAGAYSFIHDHFVLLAACVERHGGAVVKTLGDSIMAAFSDDLAGVRAAVAMQRDYRDFAFVSGHAARIGLKVGVYAGPCYAVTANGVLDYFGQTVNVAQRLETLAAGGDILLPAELARSALEAEGFAGVRLAGELRAPLKGLPEPLELARLRVD